MEDKRKQIVTATITCLETLGLAQTSLSDVCTAAKISRGALYIHFSSRDELLEAVVDQLGESGLTSLSFDSVESCRKSLEAHVRFLSAPAGGAAAYLELEILNASRVNERLRARLDKAMSTRFEHLSSGLQRLGKADMLNPGLDAAAAALAIDAFLSGVAASALAGRPAATNLKALRLILSAVFPRR